MKRKIEQLTRQIQRYTEMLDHAATLTEIGEAIRMKRLYENVLLSLEEDDHEIR